MPGTMKKVCLPNNMSILIAEIYAFGRALSDALEVKVFSGSVIIIIIINVIYMAQIRRMQQMQEQLPYVMTPECLCTGSLEDIGIRTSSDFWVIIICVLN